MAVDVTVQHPGGLRRVVKLIGRDNSKTCLLRFGPLQPLYKFDAHSGVSKDSKLRGWRVVEEDLERFREAVRAL